MNLLTEIDRSPGINRRGKTIHRTAVRGVVLRRSNLLMIYSSNVGDYKFPGGGVDAGESHAEALTREIREECGMSLRHIGLEVGAVIEYDIPLEQGFDVFKMTSHYYQCEVEDGVGNQKLDRYEQELGFKPVWIEVSEAIQSNRVLLDADKTPEWLRREIFVLEYIQQNLLQPQESSTTGHPAGIKGLKGG